MYNSIRILENRSPKFKCQQGQTPSEASRKEAFLASSSCWWPQASLGLWQHKSNLCLLHHRSFPVCLSVLCPLLRRTPLTGFRYPPLPYHVQEGFISGSVSHYICKDSISKWGHILRFWMKLNLGRNICHPTAGMELEALFNYKYTLESLPWSMYDCTRDCTQNIFHLITIPIVWVDILFLVHLRMPKVVCHQAASFKFRVIFFKHKNCHNPT